MVLEVEVVVVVASGNTEGDVEEDVELLVADELVLLAEAAVSPVTGELASEGLMAGESEEEDDDEDEDEELGLLLLLLELLLAAPDARVISTAEAAAEAS